MENTTHSHPKSKNGFSMMTVVWILVGLAIVVLGYLGVKMLFSPFNDYKVTIVDAPKEAPAGGISTFTWRVDGPKTVINTTTVRFGTASNPGEIGKDVKPGDTSYTETLTDFANGNYNVPLQFIGNMKLPSVGTYYFRVHALVNGKNYWSPEGVLEVKPAEWRVSLLDAPKAATAGKTATFTWRVEGPATEINSTSVYLGTVSTPGTLSKTVAPSSTTYPDMVKDFVNGKYVVPLTFVGNVQVATPGAYFYRVHALVNGQHYWGPEGTLEVKAEVKNAVKGVSTEKVEPTVAP